MRERIARRKDLIPKIKPGSFLEVPLAPGYYTYARKLEGLGGFAFYELLTTEPTTYLAAIAENPVLLNAPVMTLDAPSWPVIGHLPLEAGWPGIKYAWKCEPPPFIDESSKELIFQPNTEFFLGKYVDHAPLFTPAEPDTLRGLPRQSLYEPEFIEDKLRLHHGLLPTGERIAPLPLTQQPLW
jgi:hypothetical protein